MVTPLNVAVLVGSLHKDAYSRKIAHVLVGLPPASLDCRIVEMADLPLYTEDLDSAPPASWTRFRAEIQGADAVLIVTPEYKRSIPGGLKNAIDVGSRPSYHSVWMACPPRGQCLTVQTGWIRREPSRPPELGVPEHASTAAAGSVLAGGRWYP